MKKILATMAVACSLAVTAFAAPAGQINWDKGSGADVVVYGVGSPGEYTGSRGNMLARRAAVVDGYRALAEQVYGVQVNADSTIEKMAVENDTIRTNVSAVIKGAKIVDEGTYNDGSYWVKLSLPVYGDGSVAAAILPEAYKDIATLPAQKVSRKDTALDKGEYREAKKSVYTGVVVDASGLGLECTMAPQIIDTNGRIIYGMENIDMDFAVKYGLVEYKTNLNAATGGGSRAGNNALVVKAKAVKGGSNSVNPVNVVVSPEDADRILLAATNKADLFRNGAIVFVR